MTDSSAKTPKSSANCRTPLDILEDAATNGAITPKRIQPILDANRYADDLERSFKAYYSAANGVNIQHLPVGAGLITFDDEKPEDLLRIKKAREQHWPSVERSLNNLVEALDQFSSKDNQETAIAFASTLQEMNDFKLRLQNGTISAEVMVDYKPGGNQFVFPKPVQDFMAQKGYCVESRR
jgi:hypothetical protein